MVRQAFFAVCSLSVCYNSLPTCYPGIWRFYVPRRYGFPVARSGEYAGPPQRADQLENAWNYTKTLDLPTSLRDVSRVVICGMGGSAISGDLLAALVEPTCLNPIFVNRDYTLPPYAAGADTLVIALSYSGTTEETLSAARQAIERGTRLLAITTGGELSSLIREAGGTVWTFDYPSQPRAALGWLYGLLLGAAVRMGLAPDLAADVVETVARMRRDGAVWTTDTRTNRNTDKRVAGQLMDCIPVIWGAGLLAPVARRWKTQLNENSKTNAYFEALPELNHNAVAGILAPEELMARHKFQIVQLVSAEYDHPRVALRHQATEQLLREAGIITEVVKARGSSRLTQQFNLIQFGDYVSYYLAMGYGVDPTPIPPIKMLKEKLTEAG
jgi:glucose/mannose-6-phosphate isomerase